MKVIAIANAHALAHVSRLLEVAKVLRSRRHDVMFAGYGKYLEVAARDGFAVRELAYVSVEQVVSAVRSQRLWELYPRSRIQEYIAAEIALFEEERPDLVLIDNRPTARTSAEHLGLATAAVLNVHMSNYRQIPFFSMGNVLGDGSFPGVSVLDRIENAIECTAYDQLVMRGLNAIRREIGLPRLYAYEHEQAALTFFADIPEFNPVRRLPDGASYVGPVTWHNSLPAPRCVSELDSRRPTVYLSLGSEGLADLLPQLGRLVREGMQVVVATGAPDVFPPEVVPDAVFLEQYVNVDLLLPHCDAVCCHGGNGTLYQALQAGLPVVVVATHQEQAYGGKRLERLGLGRSMMLKRVQSDGFEPVVAALRHVLADGGYRTRARGFSGHFARYRGAEAIADAIETARRPR
ncbi:MAG: hypothetical protein IPF57_24200 [Gammaproteobacteria bacterium]|nr:hypothetical protein [Gammaproteobacteria bacterium]